MPEEFDPEWEYFVGDREVLDALDVAATGFDSIIDFTDAGTRRVPDGLRFGTRPRSLDAYEPREAPAGPCDPSSPPPLGKFARLRRCRRCREWFLPSRKGVVYCCPAPPSTMGRPRSRPDAVCRNPRCLKPFRPTRRAPAYCSSSCRRAVGRLARKIDPCVLVRLHLAGTPIGEMCIGLGVTYAAARRACLRFGLSTKPNRRKHLTLDEAKSLIAAGVMFGDVCPLVPEEDRDALRDWFCGEKSLPNLDARSPSSTSTPTGDACPKCGGMLVRTGTCLTCQACGESSGGCG